MAITQTGSLLQFSSTTTANTGTVSSTITVPSDATLVVVGVSGFISFSTPGFGDLTFTKGGADTIMGKGTGGDASTANWMGKLYYLALPDTGTNKTLKWDWTGTAAAADSHFNFTVTFWKGIDTSSPVRDSGGVQGALNVTITTPTLTCVTGDLIIAHVGGYFGAGTGAGNITPNGSWTNVTSLAEPANNNVAESSWATGLPTGNTAVGATAGFTGSYSEGGLSAIVLKPAAAVAGKPVKVWNGSAWVVKTVKVWSGSAWVAKPAKVWNGSAWV